MGVSESNDENFAQILKENPLVIVKYFADWCGTCRLFSPKFKKLANDDRFKDVMFLDVNAEKNPVARKKAGVDNLPFFAVFKNGELVEASSTSKEEKVVELLQKLS